MLDAGLCEDCRHARRVVNKNGSVFRLCQLHERDPHFPKYPRLPVVQCSGYVARTATERDGKSD
jgi:hypothetical protein